SFRGSGVISDTRMLVFSNCTRSNPNGISASSPSPRRPWRRSHTSKKKSTSTSLVHRDGDYHRAVHVWIYSESTQELLLQKRADCKDSWPGQWDISSAGHISAGDSSLLSAR
ncbi:hypothetical protein BHE74_00050230, partial [Ensete ventricosum]